MLRQTDSASTSCDGFYSVESSCAMETPGFLNVGPATQASCLCYSSSTWQPWVYDNYVSGCLAYLSTADAGYYSSIVADEFPTNFCVQVSTMLATVRTGAASLTSTGSPSTTASNAGTANGAACTSWDNIVSFCASGNPSFTSLSFARQASCLCYERSSWAPHIYDGYWAACLEYQRQQVVPRRRPRRQQNQVLLRHPVLGPPWETMFVVGCC
jgi:hypothetical protein